MSGFEYSRQFVPLWVKIKPPSQLSGLALREFRADAGQIVEVCSASIATLKHALQRMAVAKMYHSEWHAKVLLDSAPQEYVKHMSRLAIVFVRSSAFFIEKHNEHRLFEEHPLFRHPAYCARGSNLDTRLE